MHWAIQNKKTFSGLIPAKVSENILLIDAAGFANDVEDVNQYAAPIYAATDEAKFLEDEIKIINTNPNVANTSLTKIFVPDLWLTENWITPKPNK